MVSSSCDPVQRGLPSSCASPTTLSEVVVMQHHDDELFVFPGIHVFFDGDQFIHTEHLKSAVANGCRSPSAPDKQT